MLSAGLPQAVTVTHAIILTDSVSLLQKVKSGMGISPDWNGYRPGYPGGKGNDRADRLAGRKKTSQVVCVSEDLKC